MRLMIAMLTLALYTGTPAAAQQWYSGGTLHNKTALDWQVADSHDKLATCGDFIAKVWEGGSFKEEIQDKIHGVDDMRPYAVELVAFLDAATKKESNKRRNTQMYANQTVSDLATAGMVMMGWVNVKQ